MRRFIQIARDEKIKRILATMSPENFAMQNLCSRLGFTSMKKNFESGLIEAELPLKHGIET
jgi:RimJ/RimL family protein N-acetyltransferase